MAGPVGGLRLVDTKAHHHVEMIRQQPLDHARRAGGIIGRIAVDQHIDVGVDIGEHPPHHMALALTAFAAYLGAGRARDLGGTVRRIVVVDENFGRRQALRKSATTVATAASSLKHGTRTAIRIDEIVIAGTAARPRLSNPFPA